MQGNSPAHLRFLSASSPTLSRPTSHFSAHDYPVFTPSYEDEPLPGYSHIPTVSQAISEGWDENRLGESQIELDENTTVKLSEYTRANASSRKGLPPGLVNSDQHICPADDTKSVASSCTNHLAFLQTSPGTEKRNSRRRNSLGDLKSVSSCNKCKPAIISTDNDDIRSSKHYSNMVVPLTDSHATITATQTKPRGMILSWLLPRFKRRQKNENTTSPIRTESEEVSQALKDLGIVSIETLKRELIEANQKRDSALKEVSDMKSLFGELKKKLENLESYCEELKKALRQAVQTNGSSRGNDKLGSLSKRGKLNDGTNADSLPVSEDVMIEGFLQIVSEARLSVKQFCKMLSAQIEETDEQLMENLNQLLKPYKLSVNSRYSKAVFYHLEAIINQAFYQDFENCVFQKNGTPKLLDPHQDRQQQFQSFVALRNLSWNEVLKKGTKYYSEEFSKFCDQKMSCIIMTLNWTRQWPENLLQSFFVAAKCIWLLHLLAFSFYPPVAILRVEENRTFDPHYMEDMFTDKQKVQGPSRVKIMVMPGFYVQDKILRCKVLLNRCGTLVYKGTVFAAVGFAAGLVGTAISNGLIKMRKKMDPTFETPNKPPPTLLNAITWAIHMGVSSNFRYQTLNGVEFLLAKSVPPVVFKSSVVVLRCLNNILGGMSFVLLARLTGSQSVDDTKSSSSTTEFVGSSDGSSEEKEKLVESLPSNQST